MRASLRFFPRRFSADFTATPKTLGVGRGARQPPIPRKCDQPGGEKRPSFNLEGERVARFCKGHKETEMVDVVHKWCEKCAKLALANGIQHGG